MNKSRSTLFATLVALMAAAVFGGEFDPVNVVHSGTFDLGAPPEQAFHLFTAPGEILWAPGWNPVVLSGDGTEEGTVFVTSHGDETTIWVVVDFDLNAHRARYARLTPGSRAGTVDVRLHANDGGGATVTVKYELTALSESGNRHLAHFDAKAYSEMMKEWEQLIRAANIDFQALVPQ